VTEAVGHVRVAGDSRSIAGFYLRGGEGFIRCGLRGDISEGNDRSGDPQDEYSYFDGELMYTPRRAQRCNR